MVADNKAAGKASELESKMLDEISPTPDECRAIESAAKALIELVGKTAKDMGLEVNPILVGSVAKHTYLKKPDIDAFIQFPPSTPRQVLEEKGLAIGMKILNGKKQYAEHPYVKGTFKGFDAEIVPCFQIADSSQRMSAVDRTPFHTKFVHDNLKEGQNGQVRLFKRFLKGIGAYGAEEAVRGFSGYLAEIMVIKYGTFRGILEAASGWPEQVALRISDAAGKAAEFPKGPVAQGDTARGSAFTDVNPSMIFIDPVDLSRNVASAMSNEKYSLFVTAARQYLENPRREFFFPNAPKPLELPNLKDELAKRGTELIGILLRTPEVIADIYYSQLRKCEKGIRVLCEENGFHVIHSSFYAIGADTLFLFEFEVHSLPDVRKHRGPPVGNPREKEFAAKWENSPDRRSALHIDEGLWTVHVKREFTTADALIKAKIGTLSLGKHLNEEVKKGYKLVKGKALFSKENAEALTLLFDKRFPWGK